MKIIYVFLLAFLTNHGPKFSEGKADIFNICYFCEMDAALNKIADFIDEYRLLLDIHLVDFITEDLWKKNVPTSLQKCVFKSRDEWYLLVNEIYHGKDEIKNFNYQEDEEIMNFIANGRDNTIDYIKELTNYNFHLDEVEDIISDDYKHCMKPKKSIEINSISRIVNKLCIKHNIKNIIDVGSGKGYLSSYLALKYNFNVLGIDSQTVCSQGAVLRNEKIKKTWKSSEISPTGCMKCINLSVEATSPIIHLWCEIYKEIVPSDFLLVGLHTCGDLSVKMINLFLQTPELKVFFNIGCCYHLLEEEFSADNNNTNTGFPLSDLLSNRRFALGRRARMLASESFHRRMETKFSINPSLFYRSLLQVIIRDKFNSLPDVSIGRLGKKCSNFLEYVRKCFTKLNLDNEKISDEEIDDYLIKYQHYQDQMESLYRLRSVLAPVIESLLILDRFYYLKNHDSISQVYLTQICSPIHSPRCYALIAIKKDLN